MSAELSWQQLPIDTPSTAAFMLNGAFTGERIGEFTVNLGRSLQPLPKRLFLDIRGLKQIDRAGIDTMAGLAGLFSEHESGFLAIIGAPPALRVKLGEGAPGSGFRFYDSFGQAAQKVMDGMLAALSGQFMVLPAKPSITEEMRTCWGGMRAGTAPHTQVLSLRRAFDKVSAPSFERHWNEEFSADTRNLILDVSELRTLVDEGTEWLRRISNAIRGRDGRLVLVNPQPKVRVMLEMLEMDRLFETALSVEEAESRLR
ncbi:MAG: STAS domain-containing protein [Planctomycetes bacterium]|nr:STAS domain-containing protein [Planctomycetota bacterium]MCB9935282.1 STAS domain-containing protein [Planctomycetota bacterium]